MKNSLLFDVFSIGLLTKKDIANKYFKLNGLKAEFGKPVLTVVYTIVNNLPVINQTAPTTPVFIVEPQNKSFNVNVSDLDNDILDISWYLNSEWVKSDSSVNLDSNYSEFNFTGNSTSNGNYNISVNVTDGTVETWYEWSLIVNETVYNITNHSDILDNETVDDIANETNDTINEDVNNTENETDIIDEDINNTINETDDVSAIVNVFVVFCAKLPLLSFILTEIFHVPAPS